MTGRLAPRARFLTVLAAASLFCLLRAGPAAATDPNDLDVFFPTSLEDAFAGDAHDSEVQAAFRYDRRRGHDELLLLPQFQNSPAEGLLLNFGIPYVVGSGPQSNAGQVAAGAFYQVNRETRFLPAFAVAVDASAPIGPGDRAAQLQLTGVASRSLDRDGRHRIHLNAAWQRRFAPSEDERRNGYRFVAGYSVLATPDLALIADFVRDRQDKGVRDANIVEVGFRRRLTERVTLGCGLGAGIGADSPRLRALLSLEIDL